MDSIYNFLVYFVWFLSTFYVVAYMLILLDNRNNLYNKDLKLTEEPLVSIIVPAYNEEDDIKKTIDSLKKITYKKIEVIIISDGSKDKTSEIVRKNIVGDSRFVFIDNKNNKGKPACLNQGISLAKGKYVACMDADSMVEQGIFEKVLPYFKTEKVGAVTVSVETYERKTFLHKLVDIEYRIGLSLFLKLASFLDTVFVTPGPFSVYRKSALDKIGGFDVNNITEDLEIAYRLQKHHYKIENCLDAKVYTVLPEDFKGLYIQRKRWYTGALQTLRQHKDMMFNRKYGLFGFLVPFNYFLIFAGLVVLIVSLKVLIGNLLTYISYFHYAGLTLFDKISMIQIDLLTFGNSNVIALFSILATFTVNIIGLKVLKFEMKDNFIGFMAFPLMFFLYNLYWTASIINFLTNRKVRWR